MRRGASPGAVVLLLLAAACAPAARRAAGPVSEAIEAALASGTGGFDHRAWDELLAKAVRGGLVDYRTLQEHRRELDGYLDAVAAVDLAGLAPAELEALLLNAYNALTVATILDHPEVSSIREISGVWTVRRHRIGGFELTLDELEHGILRPYFRDPRVHFAVNCASLSCPPLAGRAFRGPEIDAQLDGLERAFLSRAENVRVEEGRLLLSRIFDWYGDDFTTPGWRGAHPTVAGYVRRFVEPEVALFIDAHDGSPPLGFLDYDWSLNAATPPDPALGGVEEPAGGGWVARLRGWVAGAGVLGGVVYGVVYVLATVAFVPGSALTIGAGVAFGLVAGTVLVSAASTVGAALAFLLSRYLLRRRVERWVAGNRRFASIDRAVAREGWKIVALTRLSPVFPFNLLNYAYGLTGVGFWPYVLASWAAMLPGTLLYVYVGVAGAEVAESAAGAGAWGKTLLQFAGLGATLAVTLLVARLARRALRRSGEI